ncbi:MAG: hypothetical protein ABGW88_13660 [Leeuwenhoekiella sp.]|uniref:hypothetical protein n=1 Tax=Leeuwenhoekiella sp. TaxID=1977054 RepID=UPI0032428A31
MDFLLDSDNDLLIQSGDMVLGDSQAQEIEMLLVSYKGQWKESPLTGAAIHEMIKSRSTSPAIKREINVQLANDGFKTKKVTLDFPNVTVDAFRI